MRSAEGSTSRRTTLHRVVAATLVVAFALLTAGCDLRLETPPPAPLVPDQLEQIRQRTSADALTLQVLATKAVEQEPDEAVRATLDGVRATSTAHLEALGGIYEPTPATADAGPGTPAAGPTLDEGATDSAPMPEGSAAPTASTPPDRVTAQAVVDLLAETAASARADASAAPDGRLARLLGSVTVGRLLLADALGRAADLEPLPGASVPEPVGPPVTTGLAPHDLAALVQSEDALGLAWEVTAGRSADDARRHAAERARAHRERAEAWAQAAAIAGTGLDPRRSWYDLPPELTTSGTDPAAARADLAALEGGLAADYMSLVASAEPTSRSALVDAALEASREQVALGGPLLAFPGMPERT